MLSNQNNMQKNYSLYCNSILFFPAHYSIKWKKGYKIKANSDNLITLQSRNIYSIWNHSTDNQQKYHKCQLFLRNGSPPNYSYILTNLVKTTFEVTTNKYLNMWLLHIKDVDEPYTLSSELILFPYLCKKYRNTPLVHPNPSWASYSPPPPRFPGCNQKVNLQ